MSNHIPNILSVDFDYFQNPSLSTFKKYPVGIDLPPDMSNAFWRETLREHSKDIAAVPFDRKEFSLLISILTSLPSDISVQVAFSHVEAYCFARRIAERWHSSCVNLVNVDMHHDIINENDSLDCGNWIGKLLEEKKVGKFNWVAKPLSKEMYGLTDEEFVSMKGHIGLETLADHCFDAVFICRSNPWVPPAFDEYFSKLVGCCEKHFNSNALKMELEVAQKRNLAA